MTEPEWTVERLNEFADAQELLGHPVTAQVARLAAKNKAELDRLQAEFVRVQELHVQIAAQVEMVKTAANKLRAIV